MVYAVRRGAGEKRVGHAGTLDPLATGLLVMCLGPATRLSEFLAGKDKRYTARLRFGQTTNTYDSQGQVTATHARPDRSGQGRGGPGGFPRPAAAGAAGLFGDQARRTKGLRSGAARRNGGARAAFGGILLHRIG